MLEMYINLLHLLLLQKIHRISHSPPAGEDNVTYWMVGRHPKQYGQILCGSAFHIHTVV